MNACELLMKCMCSLGGKSLVLITEDLRFTLVVYHLPTKSGNFGWIVNGKSNFVSPNGNFLGKTGFFER